MNYTPQEAFNIAKTIAMQCKLGHITYDEGKKQTKPFFDIVNAKAKEIAKKYGTRPTLLRWEGFTR